MIRSVISIAIVSTLAACSSPMPKQEASASLIEKETPDWFLSSVSTLTAYKSVGDGVSSSLSGALSNARAAAFEGICQSAGGTVRSQTKIFRQDTEGKSASISTTAIRNFCPDVDVSSASIEKSKVIRDGSQFRAFVLVTMDKNTIASKAVTATSAQEFKELDYLNTEFQQKKK